MVDRTVVADYLHELRKLPLLTPGEEARLWRRYKGQGDARSRARLIESYQPLVFKLAMRLRLRREIVMDMIQEGTVGLIEAVERYDPGRGVRFSTFAAYRIRGRILNALDRERALPVVEGPEGELVQDLGAADRLARVEDALVIEQIATAIGRLPEREQRILRAMISREEEPRRIAGELRISLSHLYRLQKQAVQRLQAHLVPAAPGARAQG
ncbi:MAG: sigma-70 family RNA polymerase sigma factor [Bacillati bacterium ANGP1]|uniref:Sigma-70 family RNA polymerase sigma factor n=1 Tax=Candidatus Segetimicrobium genomatis TaxID=2569760 RepID=A0A537LRU9_9BACT|nr:MAG: sigma-70 family RNA polymerase sigma factor [Terrabacteria group bacterium ANGP1]